MEGHLYRCPNHSGEELAVPKVAAAMEGHLYRCPNGSIQNLALTWGFGHGLRAVSVGSHHRS